jgi:transposase-like protein
MAFKQQVIADLESGRFGSIEAAREHYGIGGKGTVRRWLKKYGRNHLAPKVIRVEKPDEADQIRQLKQQVEQFQKALGRTQLEKMMEEAFLHQACLAMGTDAETFKKKVATTPSTGLKRNSKRA